MDDGTGPLVVAAGRGDATALEALMARYLPELHAFVRLRVGPRLLTRETPDDMVQSACREVLADLPAFEYRGEASFKKWLFLAAWRKIRDRARFYDRQQRAAARERAGAGDDVFQTACASILTPSRVAMGREQVERFEVAFAELSDDQRAVVTSSRLCGMSHAEIAVELGKTPEAVRVILHRALAKLGRLLEED